MLHFIFLKMYVRILYTLNWSDAASLSHTVATYVFGNLQLSHIGLCLVCRHAHNILLHITRVAEVVHLLLSTIRQLRIISHRHYVIILSMYYINIPLTKVSKFLKMFHDA
jgi:hypothetical protein